jgi:hypothetical protein
MKIPKIIYLIFTPDGAAMQHAGSGGLAWFRFKTEAQGHAAYAHGISWEKLRKRGYRLEKFTHDPR